MRARDIHLSLGQLNRVDHSIGIRPLDSIGTQLCFTRHGEHKGGVAPSRRENEAEALDGGGALLELGQYLCSIRLVACRTCQREVKKHNEVTWQPSGAWPVSSCQLHNLR